MNCEMSEEFIKLSILFKANSLSNVFNESQATKRVLSSAPDLVETNNHKKSAL